MSIQDFLKLTAADFETLDTAQLETLQQQASAWREELKAQARVLVAVLDRKIQAAQTQRLIAGMSDEQRHILVQHIQNAGNIETDETVTGL